MTLSPCVPSTESRLSGEALEFLKPQNFIFVYKTTEIYIYSLAVHRTAGPEKHYGV